MTSKHLVHPNIVLLLGVKVEPFELISEWMPGGGLQGYIAKRPDADRLSLVGFFSYYTRGRADPFASYLTSPRVSTTCIPVMLFTEILTGSVIVPDLISSQN